MWMRSLATRTHSGESTKPLSVSRTRTHLTSYHSKNIWITDCRAHRKQSTKPHYLLVHCEQSCTRVIFEIVLGEVRNEDGICEGKYRGNEKTTTKQMRELKTFAMQCKSQPQKKCHKLKFCAIYDWFMWFVNRSTKHIQWYIVRDGLSEFIIITQTFSIQIRMPGICLRCVAERAHTRACAQMNFVVTISVEHRCVYQLANCAAGTKAMAMTYTLLASCARVQ